MNIYMMKKPKRINSISVSIFIVAVLLGYFGYFLVPVYWPIFQLTGMMRGACNEAYRVHDNEKVLQSLLKDARRTGLKLSKDNFRLTRTEVTQEELEKHESVAFRNLLAKRGKACVLEMRYRDSYEWPVFGKKTTITFDRRIERELEQVKWEKTCTCVTAQSPF